MKSTAKLKLVDHLPPETVRGSVRFINLTRNPALVSPTRFEPTVKLAGDVVI